MRYLFVDRIDFIERHRIIRAIKNVALSEDVFSEHFVGYPVMPGALLLESLAQAGTALLEVSSLYQKKALPVLVREAKFRSLVRPGDRLDIEARILSHDEVSAAVEGVIRVSGKAAVTASLAFTLQDVAQFYPARTRYLVDALYDTWLRDAQLAGFDTSPLPAPRPDTHA